MKHLSDQQLKNAIESVVVRERGVTMEVVKLLKEFDRRKLFSAMGFTSLFDYATKQLKYSPDQANRRIAAMRVLREVPEAEAKVIDGSLSLSALAQAHWHFNKVKHSTEEKKEVLVKLENATKKETKAILKQEYDARYSFVTDAEGEKLIEELRALHPHLNFDQLMLKVCKMAFEKISPVKKIERAEARVTKQLKAKSETKPEINPENGAAVKSSVRTSAGKVTPSRYIPAEVKRVVWSKSEGKCVNCKSTYALEYDHVIPFAKGGSTTVQNLRLLCRNCNHRHAIERYGMAKIAQYR